jgi:phosphomethylpyrimidine synthase
MRITEDVLRYAAEQRLTDETAIRRGLVDKAKEFDTAEGDVYQKV